MGNPAAVFTKEEIRRALALDRFDSLAAQAAMIPRPRADSRPSKRPGSVRLGAVLLLLYPVDGEPYLVLTRRPDSLRDHAGQIALPGGSRDDGETLAGAALRETEEEIGVSPAQVELLGALSTLYIPPSDFEVHPFVGWRAERPSFRRSPREVAEIIETPLRQLFDPVTRAEEMWELRGMRVAVPYFHIDGHKVWGATAMILSEFVERLRHVRQ